MKEEMGAVRSTSTDKEIDLLQLLGALFTQWKMIISVTAGFMLAALFYALLTPPVYQADTLIQVEQKQGQALLSSLSSVLPDSAPEVAPEIELLKSRMILGKTVDDLNLKTQAEQISFPVVGRLWSRLTGEKTGQIMIQKMTLPLTDGKSPALVLTVEENDAYLLEGENLSLRGKVGQLLKGKDIAILISAIQASPGTRFSLHQQTLLEAINGLQKSVSVAIQGKGSGMLVLSITGHHPDKLVMILNSITDNYLQQNVARQAARDANSLTFLQSQLPKVRHELDLAENKLNNYRKLQDSVDLNLEAKSVLEQTVNVENQLNALTFREAEVSQLYKKSHPAYRALLEKRQTLLQEKERLNNRISAMPSTQQEVLRLSRDVESGRAIYLQLLSRQQELNISRSSAVGNVRIIDPAETWPVPVKPKKALIVLLGTLCGLMISVGFVLARVALRQKVESMEALESQGINVLATVPKSEYLERKRRHQQKRTLSMALRDRVVPRLFLASEEPADVAVEAIRSLRTTLHFIMQDAPNQVLMISGATTGCGKTFISTNLAAVIANSGHKILFIDADMRRGYTHTLLNIGNKSGLSEVLSGQAEATQSIQHCQKGGFDILTRGSLSSSPADLLMNERFSQLLEWANRAYDMVIVDCPPVLAVTDAVIVGRAAGIRLIVARAGADSVKEIKTCLHRLTQGGVGINGVVLNGVSRTAADYYAYDTVE